MKIIRNNKNIKFSDLLQRTLNLSLKMEEESKDKESECEMGSSKEAHKIKQRDKEGHKILPQQPKHNTDH